MFQVKICGVKTAADAIAAAEAGADAVGLNFYARSSRYVEPAAAAEICRVLGDRVCKVGVFVNSSAADVADIARAAGLDLIQLHGDEPPAVLRGLEPWPVMKAFRVGPEGLAPVRTWFDEAMHLGLMPQRVLLDAFQPGEYGGTGRTADWSAASAYARNPALPPLVLAGGLTADNVAAAIEQVRPVAVDTAGGVESSPGVKDHGRMREFIAAAKAAFSRISAG
ncbi:MAG: phosphoribosylanthranilate isomerase [Planctomycetales bacterium]|nr:phosphoribosylanthranilate isomerase [Planctomycetales bacterium]MBN8628519.1 phosphoribosylanthranilate isomerase [Planctomycetota bacterium]